MDLYLVRHAIAVERGDPAYPWDDDRPLTPDGIHKFRLAARGLARLDVRPARILSSPLIRARQTAEIVRDALAPHLDIDVVAGLKPGSSYADTLGALDDLHDRSIAVVGHEPHLSGFASFLIGAPKGASAVLLRKGATALVTFPDVPAAGLGTLEWLMQPGMLRSLVRE